MKGQIVTLCSTMTVCLSKKLKKSKTNQSSIATKQYFFIKQGLKIDFELPIIKL